jgi:hypothetical protein
VQGEFNTSQPQVNLKASVKDFERITLVEFPGEGSYIEWTQPCMTQMVSTFLKAPGSKLDTGCIENIPALRFVLPE